jgi:Urocanase Rossmann-like domain
MPSEAVIADNPQTRTLRIFTVLTCLRPDWAGDLILSCGLSGSGADLALAANIAGAACLSIDRSTEACRAAMRSGAVDFVVNTVDEALRVLKNEIRKHQPISVALEGDSATNLRELLDRGVLPQLFTAFALSPEDPDRAVYLDAATRFEAQGASLVDFSSTLRSLPSAIASSDVLNSYTAEHALSLESFPFDSPAALRTFDARVLDLIPTEDPRHRWATTAPRHFHRSHSTKAQSYTRALFVTAQEKASLMSNP